MAVGEKPSWMTQEQWDAFLAGSGAGGTDPNSLPVTTEADVLTIGPNGRVGMWRWTWTGLYPRPIKQFFPINVDLNNQPIKPLMPVAGWTGTIPAPGTGAGFGDPRTGHKHAGIDISAPRGTSAVAVVSGRIRRVQYAPGKGGARPGGGGNIIWLEDENGAVYKYMHMDTIDVREGDYVYQGDRLGGIGDTGNPRAGAYHLHFEYYPNGPDGPAVDPRQFFYGATYVGENDVYRYPAIPGMDTRAAKESINDIFQEWLGRDASPAEQQMILDGNWSSDHVFRYIKGLSEWKGSPGWERLRAHAQSAWTDLVGGTAPQDFIDAAIAKEWTDEQIAEEIRKRPEYKNGREYQTTRVALIDEWETKVGRDMPESVKLALDKALAENWTLTQWRDFIEQQPEYKIGVEYQGRVTSVLNQLDELWGYGAVDDKLASDPDYVENTVWKELGTDASPDAIERWARKQPEWMVGPQASASRVALRTYWGEIMRTPIDDSLLDEWVRDGMTIPQALEYMRGTPQYQAWYAAMPPWMEESQFNDERRLFDAYGRWYFKNDDFRTSNGQLSYYFEHGISPQEVLDRYRWTEEAASQTGDAPGSWAYDLAAVGITLTPEMAYIMASGAEGSGKLFAALLKGKNRRSFDEAFTMYTGHRPTEADYAYLETNYVSSTEYARRMAAKEYSIEMFPLVNEMFMRVYGYEADLQQLQDVAMGAEGSGAYKALITAAEELDRFTLPWREYARTDPTPQQYAQWAGFAGPSELEKLLRAQELVRSHGREIMDVYNSYWVMMGAAPISEADVLTLQGQYMGWGAIDERLRRASEHRERMDRARQQWLASPAAQAYSVATQFGGTQVPFLVRPQG